MKSIPMPPDDHMARAPYRGDPNKLLPTTITWLKGMQEEVNAGHARRGEAKEVWFDANDNLV
jgi:hypothetical protein